MTVFPPPTNFTLVRPVGITECKYYVHTLDDRMSILYSVHHCMSLATARSQTPEVPNTGSASARQWRHDTDKPFPYSTTRWQRYSDSFITEDWQSLDIVNPGNILS